jgi:hypothetical protein
MEGDIKRPRDTREFLARWNAATEEHLVHQLQSVLANLAREGTLPVLTDRQLATFAPMLVHAFQAAAGPDGGAHAGIDFLSEQAPGSGASPA